MLCQECNNGQEFEILFSCQTCKKDLCTTHFQNHNCVQKPLFDLQTIFQRAQQSITKEPTAQEYEQYLKSNPTVLTSGKESIDISIALVLLFAVFGLRLLINDLSNLGFVILLTLSISPAFILHELAHKYAAIYYKKYARFALIKNMTYFTIIAAILGIPLAGPGATVILGRSTVSEQGKFSAAGPATNFVLGLFFLLLYLILPTISFVGDYTINNLLILSIFINGFLGIFNLIPVSILDGKKIFDWDKVAWSIILILNLSLLIFSYPMYSDLLGI